MKFNNKVPDKIILRGFESIDLDGNGISEIVSHWIGVNPRYGEEEEEEETDEDSITPPFNINSKIHYAHPEYIKNSAAEGYSRSENWYIYLNTVGCVHHRGIQILLKKPHVYKEVQLDSTFTISTTEIHVH